MPSSLLDLERHARDYWNVDGLPTLVAGISYVLLGAVTLAPWSIQHPFSALLLGLVVFYSLGELTIPWLKARITYPRTGYVVPSDPPSSLIEGHFVSIHDADTLESERYRERDRIHRQHLARVAVGLVVVFTFSMLGAFIDDHGIFLRAAVICVTTFVFKPPFYKFTWIELVACPAFAILIASLPATRHYFGLVFVAVGLISSLRGLVALLRYFQWSRSLAE